MVTVRSKGETLVYLRGPAKAASVTNPIHEDAILEF